MADQQQYPDDEPRTVRVLLDRVAVVMIVIGVIGLAVAASLADWRLGLATLSVSSVAVGVALGTSR